MKPLRILAAALAVAATPSFAALPFVTPIGPTTNDTVVLEVQGDQPCASLIPGTVEMANNVIRVRYETGIGVLCLVAVPQPQKIALGRLPAGTYNVQLVAQQDGAVVAVSVFTVSNPPASGDRGPLDNYSGHWVSEGAGANEGVFVTQFGRTAFVSYLYYADDGSPQWAIVSDARWDPATNSFSGGLMRVERLSSGVGSGTGLVTSYQYVGAARFTPGGQFDRARFEGNIFSRVVNRELSRFRF